jgi:PPM family protein phosphatase
MAIRPGIEVASLSDLGCQREDNEDSYSYWEPAGDAEFAEKGRLAVVADGMGGHEGGQEASRIAVEVIQEVYAGTPATDPQALLTAGFQEAHQRIQSYAVAHPKLRGMGTTATAAVIVADQLYYAHIGDSRLYRVTRDEVARLTHDHSYVGRLVESGVISPQEAEAHPQRNILTAALGAGLEILVETPELPITLKTGDILVLCTDGLWGQLTDLELQTAVLQNAVGRTILLCKCCA